MKRLRDQGKVTPEALEAAHPALEKEFVFPPDILAAIKKNPVAWEHYRKFSLSYQRIRVAAIEGARKRPEMDLWSTSQRA